MYKKGEILQAGNLSSLCRLWKDSRSVPFFLRGERRCIWKKPTQQGRKGRGEMELRSQEMRKNAPELDPLRIGTGWKPEDLSKTQVMIESTYGDSHPGSGHLNILVEEVRKGIEEAGGHGARYYCTDICDGESQGTDGINYCLVSREMIANMIEIHANATPFDAGVYLASCDKGLPGNLMGKEELLHMKGHGEKRR